MLSGTYRIGFLCMTFATRLQYLRQQANLTQRQLAEQTAGNEAHHVTSRTSAARL